MNPDEIPIIRNIAHPERTIKSHLGDFPGEIQQEAYEK